MPYQGAWSLSSLPKPGPGAPRVFSCFACGGGSSMGYKLAGCDVIGINEIDPRMVETYRLNMSPRLVYQEPIQSFKDRDDLPSELYDLDILDGSPPCSTFSTAGSREGAWGKMKVFREGQSEQVLDRLFFDFLSLAERLKPKVVVAENVKGMLKGNARAYCRAIMERLDKAGYDAQLFLLNAAFMGVPQARERVFFVGRRRDLGMPPVDLSFSEPSISCVEATSDLAAAQRAGRPLGENLLAYWLRVRPGQAFSKVHPKGSYFNQVRLNGRRPATTLPAAGNTYHWSEPRHLSHAEILRLSTFPDDYRMPEGSRDSATMYICGMSVPPRMVERVASRIRSQLLDTLKTIH